MAAQTLKEKLAAAIRDGKTSVKPRVTPQAPAGVKKLSASEIMGLKLKPTEVKLAETAGVAASDAERRRKLLWEDNINWTRPTVTPAKATAARKVGEAIGSVVAGGVTEFSKQVAADAGIQQRATDAGLGKEVSTLVTHAEHSAESDAELGRQYREFLQLETERKAALAAARLAKKRLDAAAGR